MAEFKKLTYVDGALWFNGQLVATVSDEWIRGNIQTIKNILEVSSGGPGVAADVSYDNTISQILATNVQTAIDEIHEEIDDRAGACEARLDVVEDNIEGLVDSINIEVIPEELGDTVGDAISSINDSLTKRYTQLVSTSSNIVINVNTTQYKEFFIEYIVGNSANVPFFIPYGCKRNTRYRVHYKNDYANITFTDSTIEIGIANTEYTGTTVNILAR